MASKKHWTEGRYPGCILFVVCMIIGCIFGDMQEPIERPIDRNVTAALPWQPTTLVAVRRIPRAPEAPMTVENGKKEHERLGSPAVMVTYVTSARHSGEFHPIIVSYAFFNANVMHTFQMGLQIPTGVYQNVGSCQILANTRALSCAVETDNHSIDIDKTLRFMGPVGITFLCWLLISAACFWVPYLRHQPE